MCKHSRGSEPGLLEVCVCLFTSMYMCEYVRMEFKKSACNCYMHVHVCDRCRWGL